jgi:glycosyltransferase involved in cell wall biosynthesis
MNVLYFDPKFLTPGHASPTRAYSIARELVGRGHRVTMVARDPRWLALTPRTPPALLGTREEVDGIDVLWLRIPYQHHFSKGARLLSYGAYGLGATVAAGLLGRPDVVYASSTPLTAGIPGAFASRFRGVPFVFELLDLWPAAPIALGHLSRGLEISLAEALERTLYAQAEKLVVCNAAVRSTLIRRGVPAAKIVLVPNFSDTELFEPGEADGEFRLRHGLDRKLVAIYAGGMGATNGVYQLADAAAALKRRGEERIQIVALGDGNERPKLERRVREERLDNLLLLDPVAREQVPSVIGACDVTLTVFAPHPVLALNAPNKFFDSLAAGKPVVVNVDGWLRTLVEENDAGVYAPPGDGDALAAALTALAQDPEGVRRMGMNARALADREFARDLLTGRVATMLEDVACTGARQG